jgi:hypothetical protein
MRRIWLLALAATAIVVFPTSALASGAHHHKKKKTSTKSAAYKSGTYKATSSEFGEKFTIALTGGKVSLPASTIINCKSLNLTNPAAGFVAPAALSASGSITEHAPLSVESVPGAPPLTGQATFSVSFTKQGTASGYLEESLAGTFGKEPVSCASGKEPFTAKLG